jgi:hypothetical protein
MISTDLVHWKWLSNHTLPQGSEPGSVLPLGNNANYTAAAVYGCNGSICIAFTNSSSLETWITYSNNPIIKPMTSDSSLSFPRLFMVSLNITAEYYSCIDNLIKLRLQNGNC